MSESNIIINLDSNSDKSKMTDDIEKDIVDLKQMLKFLVAKLQLIKLDYLNEDYKDIEHKNLIQKREQLLELTMKTQLIRGATQNAITNEFLRTHVMKLETSDLASQKYKQKIIEQLNSLRTTSEQVKVLHDKQLKILEESRRIQNQLIDQGGQLKNYLDEAVLRRENENQPNSMRQTEMADIQLRIKKINFMRTITSRLLCHSDIDWQKYPQFVELLRNCRTPYNVEELLD